MQLDKAHEEISRLRNKLLNVDNNLSPANTPADDPFTMTLNKGALTLN